MQEEYLTRRKRIKSSLRRDIIEKFGYTCCLCNTYLFVFDIHHIKFVSIGGANDPENLIPLCPNCHRIFPHHLREDFDESLIRLIRNRWLDLNSRVSTITKNLSGSTINSALMLLDEETRFLTMLFGSYERMVSIAEMIRTNMPTRTAGDLVIRSRIVGFESEMSLYLGKQKKYESKLESAIRTLSESKELSRVAWRAKIVMSRIYGRKGDVERQYRFIEDAFPMGCKSNSEELLEWIFRKMSFYNARGNFRKVQELSKYCETEVTTPMGRTLISSIMDEVGRASLYTGQTNEAENLIKEALGLSMKDFHRRGIYFRHVYLAKTYMTFGDYEKAAEHFFLASQYREVSAFYSPSLAEIQSSLEKKIGIDGLKQIWRKHQK